MLCRERESPSDVSQQSFAQMLTLRLFSLSPSLSHFLPTSHNRGFLWYRIRSLRLDPAAYSALRAGPDDSQKGSAYTTEPTFAASSGVLN